MASRLLLVLGVSAALLGCGGGGAPNGGITALEAHRFLLQTSFGPAPGDVARVQAVGIESYLDSQLSRSVSRQLPYLQALPQPVEQFDRHEAFLRNAMRGNDQLRQRVAFALSQIFVVSENSGLTDYPLALASYHDLLASQAFGNFRQLMEDVTLHPAMGFYLSMLGNEKPDVARNIRPDENYARELMQLFTIGLVELNENGTERLNGNGEPIPTYDQAIIEGFAHVNTGWTFGGSPAWYAPSYDFLQPMQAFEAFHDTGTKKLLNGVVLPGGRTARADLESALDNIFQHPNVGPFIGRQLIQRLVTSNPSPEYVARVARVFANNGQGERGDLRAVIRAILLDREARDPLAGDTTGRLQEPILRLTRLWRAYEASAPNGRFLLPSMGVMIGQAPLAAPSVFNFYRPSYAPPGEISARGLVAPEMQIATEFSVALLADMLGTWAIAWNNYADDLEPDRVRLDLSGDEPYADTPARLVSRVAERLTGGVVSPTLRAEAEAVAAQYPADQRPFRIIEVLNLFVMSPEYALEL
jgi:uncharacterized protein (DUF1800 family)